MGPWDTGRDNQSVITLEVDSTFQPIRGEYYPHVTIKKIRHNAIAEWLHHVPAIITHQKKVFHVRKITGK